MFVSLYIGIYIISGVLAYGATRAYWDVEMPKVDHHDFSCFIASFGPFGLAVTFVASGFWRRGFKWM
jgi:hypothetical protein